MNNEKKKEVIKKTEEGIRKYNELLRRKIMTEKTEETKILKDIEEEKMLDENITFNSDRSSSYLNYY